MPRPIVEKDTPTADFLNSLFLRPVWRKHQPIKSREVTNKAPSQESVPTPASQADGEEKTSLTEEEMRAWAGDTGGEFAQRKPATASTTQQAIKQKRHSKSVITVSHAQSMVFLSHLLPELEKLWGVRGTATRLRVSRQQYTKLQSGKYSPIRIPVFFLLGRVDSLVSNASPNEQQALRDALSAARKKLLSDADTLPDRLNKRIGSAQRARRLSWEHEREKRSRSRRATSPETTLGSTQAAKETPRAEAAEAEAAEWHDEQ